MVIDGKHLLTSEELRQRLLHFWNETLEIETIQDRLVFTMPVSYPDGWQVVLDLRQIAPSGFLLSDQGKTLAWLQAQGQNVSTASLRQHLDRLAKEHGLQEEGGVFTRWLSAPVEAVDLQVFAEGLAAIARLDVLHDHRVAEENVADSYVKRIFADAGMQALQHHPLNITRERKVYVDYFIEKRRPLAMQLLKSRSDVNGSMERWGYRWGELKKSYDGLMPVMLYDRNTMRIEPYARQIGESSCDLFCGYDETDRIHAVLASIS